MMKLEFKQSSYGPCCYNIVFD